MPYKNYIYEYHAKITSGEIVAGKWIKEIYKIIVGGLEKQEYFFNAKAANKAIKFIENFCHHSKGRNDLIKLELWQKAIVSIIFGIQDAEKTRIFREIFIVIGRKNGKSLFASAIIAYMVYLEPEYGQEIYCLAPKLDQATLVYDGFYKMVQAEDELNELAKKRRSDIYYEETNSFVKPIAFNAKKSDGFNPQLVVCDEMAAWSGDAGLKQYEVMKSALGARRQPMILSISTAGYINDSIYDELMKRSTSFLKGNSKERRLLPFLYMIDDVEKWNDIEELKKANPNMGVSVPESFFMDEIAVAENSLSKRAEFLTKYCNIKQNSSIAWLEYATVDGAGIEKTLEDFRDCYAVGGIDLSQTTDLTAASVVIERDGVLYAFTQFFMPRGTTDKTEYAGKEVYKLDAGSSGLYASTTQKYKQVEATETKLVPVEVCTTLTTDSVTGKISFKGLGEGIYTLTETKTPAGYNTINPITFTVKFTAPDSVTDGSEQCQWEITGWTTDEDGNQTILSSGGIFAANIINVRGTLLPSTGGIGTTIFYVAGSILVLAAVVLLVTKKRMTKEK